MRFQTGIGTASEPHRTAVLFGFGTAGTAGIAKKAGIGTTGTAGTAGIAGIGTAVTAKTAGIRTAGTASEKSWNCPCFVASSLGCYIQANAISIKLFKTIQN